MHSEHRTTKPANVTVLSLPASLLAIVAALQQEEKQKQKADAKDPSAATLTFAGSTRRRYVAHMLSAFLPPLLVGITRLVGPDATTSCPRSKQKFPLPRI